MTNKKEIVYSTRKFGELSKSELDVYLDFSADVLHLLNGFDVWYAENCFAEEDDKKYEKEVLKRFEVLIDLKDELEIKVYNNLID